MTPFEAPDQHVIDAVVAIIAAYLFVLPLAVERQRKGASHVGLRTLPLVSVAACAYLLLSRFLVERGVFSPDGQARSLRALMTGIGFIGGGAILKQTPAAGHGVGGITTAASVWTTGAIGASLAYGYYSLAAVLSLASVLVIESVLRRHRPAEHKVHGLLGPMLLAVLAAPSEGTPCERSPIQLNRYEEDYAFLRARQCRTDLWDPLKHLELAADPARYLSLGADLRERFESFHNGGWVAGANDAYLLHRLMLHGDLHLGDRARWFIQLTNNWALDRAGGPGPLDADQLDLHQGFLEVQLGPLAVRAGRQELDYEHARLISTRDGANVRLSFDALRLMWRLRAWRVDAFAAAPVETQPGVFDDGQIPGQLLWGAYAFGPVSSEALSLDVFYFGFARSDAAFDQGRAAESRHSFGVRASGRPGSFDYNVELVYQVGAFGAGAINAWTVASEAGYSFEAIPLRPRLGLQLNATSGDHDPSEPSLQTFNPLFPQASYFSDANLIGPRNHLDVHPAITVHALEPLSITLHYDAFWRQSLGDGAYRSSGALIASGSTSDERHVGSELSVRAVWQVDRHAVLVASYSHFFAGPFLSEAGLGNDLDFFACWLSYRV